MLFWKNLSTSFKKQTTKNQHVFHFVILFTRMKNENQHSLKFDWACKNKKTWFKILNSKHFYKFTKKNWKFAINLIFWTFYLKKFTNFKYVAFHHFLNLNFWQFIFNSRISQLRIIVHYLMNLIDFSSCFQISNSTLHQSKKHSNFAKNAKLTTKIFFFHQNAIILK